MGRRRVSGAVTALLGAAALAACGDSGVVDVSPSLVRQHTEGLAQEVLLCKIGPAGTTATFTVSGAPTGVGNYLTGSPVTLEASPLFDVNKCRVLWQSVSPGDPTVSLTITETAMTPGTAIESILVNATLPFTTTANSVTVGVDFENGAVIAFKNMEVELPPPPPPTGQGCTPGYWGRPQHLDSWTAPYTPGTLFATVFGVNAYPGKTLLDVVNTPGNPQVQLGRMAVAALLNAAHPNVNFDLSTAQVIADFTTAWNSGNYEAQKNVFDALNNLGCPLN